MIWYFYPNVEKNTGRGTIIYIRKSIKYKQIDMKIENKEFQEAIFAEITLNNLDKLLCACFYRKGESSDGNNELLLKAIKYVCNRNYSHIRIMGDLNFKNIDWETLTTEGNSTTDLKLQIYRMHTTQLPFPTCSWTNTAQRHGPTKHPRCPIHQQIKHDLRIRNFSTPGKEWSLHSEI